MLKKLFLLTLALGSLSASAQFRLGEFFFRPSMKYDYTFNEFERKDGESFQLQSHELQCVIPLKGKIEFDLSDVSSLKDILKTKVKAHQNFVTFGGNYTTIDTKWFGRFPTTSSGFNVGLQGIGLRKKLNLYFYNINASIQERLGYTSLNPNFLAFGGGAKITGLKSVYYYGAGISYNQKQLVPFPIFGLRTKIGNKGVLSCTFPVNTSYTYKVSPKVKLKASAIYNWFNSGLNNSLPSTTVIDSTTLHIPSKGRLTFSQNDIRLDLALRIKFSNQLNMWVHCGYVPYGNFNVLDETTAINKYKLASGTFAGASLVYRFKKSFLDANLSELFF